MSDLHDDYVDGDINTIDRSDQFEGRAPDGDLDPTDRAATATAVLHFIASSLADDPAAVSVEVSERHDKVVLSLSVSADDMGRIIGRRGRTAQAIRALVSAAGVRDGVTTSVDIVD